MMMAKVQETQAGAQLKQAQAQRTVAETTGQMPSQGNPGDMAVQAMKTHAVEIKAQADLMRATVEAQAAMHDAALKAAQPLNTGPLPAK